jgi:hypothetical protein
VVGEEKGAYGPFPLDLFYFCRYNRGIGEVMAKKSFLTPSPQWWKHLRDWKRVFWKSERQAQKKDTSERKNEDTK